MKTIALLPLVALCAFTQAPKQSPGGATTTGTCSPATTGNGNTFSFTCSGLTVTQQRLLESMPALLNKLLASQTDNTTEILSKLDACIAQGAARHVTKEQADILDRELRGFAGQEIQTTIYTMDKEANDFGMEVSNALKHAGLNVGVNRTMGTTSPITGFFLVIGTNKRDLAQAVEGALMDSKIAPRGTNTYKDDEKNANILQLTIGFKP